MSLLADAPRLLRTSCSLANAEGDVMNQEGDKSTHGIVHVTYSGGSVEEGHRRDDVVPAPQQTSLLLTRGQVESLKVQLHRMLDRVGGGGEDN